MTNKIMAVVVGALVLLVVASAIYSTFFSVPQNAENQNNLMCDGDGRMCPDGSVVGRVPPACEFSECPGVMPVTGDEPLKGIAILKGTVTLSPTCPVERMPPDPKCAPAAYVTDVLAINASTGVVAAETRTTSKGEYVHDLPPGTYIIRAKGGAVLPTCNDVTVTVIEGERKTLDISCDSGIR